MLVIDESHSLITSCLEILSLNLLVELALELWKHGRCNLKDLITVFKIRQTVLSILHLNILFLNKSLLLRDILLDFLEKEIKSFLFVLLNFLELIQEPFDILWLLDLDALRFALIHEIIKFSLSVFA